MTSWPRATTSVSIRVSIPGWRISGSRSMQRQLPGIHGLRAIAATGIVLFHVAAIVTPPPEQLSFISNYFGLAVPLFFVVSGFSLGYSTAERVEKPRWIEDYLLKRFFRIAPMFYVML